jgi:hypothetical protein
MKPFGSAQDEPAFYEAYGENQVRRGYYREAIRYREHVLPIVEALLDFARTSVEEAACES